MEHDNDIKKFIYAGLLGVVVFGFSVSHAFAFSKYEISDGSVKALYNFEGSNFLVDETGANNLTQAGSIATTTGFFNDGSIGYFGTGNYLYRTTPTLTGGNSSLSISLWYKPSVTVSGLHELVSLGSSAVNNDHYYVGVSTNQLEINLWYTYLSVPVGFTYSTSTWYNIVAVWDGSQNKLTGYVNGNMIASTTSAGVNTDVSNLVVGNDTQSSHAYPAEGELDNVAFINKALSATDVSNIWNSGNGAEICITTGCGNSASVSFLSPVDGATGIDPKFPVWDTQYNIAVPNHISVSTNGQILVKYSKCSDFSCGIIYDRAPLFTTSSELLVVKSNDLILSKDWYAYLEIYDYTSSTALFGNFIASSSIIHFQVNQDLSLYPPGFAGNFVSPSSTMASSSAFYVDCTAYDNQPLFSSATIPGIFCLTQKTLYSFAGWLIIPPDWAGHDLKDAYNFSGLFPFNFIFGIRDNISASSLWTGTTYQVSTGNIPDVSLGIFGSSTTLLSSSTLVSLMTTDHCDHTCAVGNKDTAFSFLRTVIWIGGIIRMITIII